MGYGWILTVQRSDISEMGDWGRREDEGYDEEEEEKNDGPDLTFSGTTLVQSFRRLRILTKSSWDHIGHA